MNRFKITMKWLGIVAGGLVVLFIIAHTTLNILGGIELRRIIQELKDKGRPMTIAEIITPAVPDEQNAAPLIQQAITVFTNLTAGKTFEDIIRTNQDIQHAIFKTNEYANTSTSLDPATWTDQQREIALQLIHSREMQDIMTILKKASLCSGYDNHLDYTQGPAMYYPKYGGYRSIIRLLAVKAITEANNGNGTQALDTILTGLKVNGLIQQEPEFVFQFIHQACDILLLRSVEHLYPLLNQQVSPELIQLIIKELAIHDNSKAWERTMNMERIANGSWCFKLMTNVKRPNFFTPFQFYTRIGTWWCIIKTQMCRPVRKYDYAFYIKRLDAFTSCFEQPYYMISDNLKAIAQQPIPKYAFITSISMPDLSITCIRMTEHQALLAVSRTALACQLYKQKMGQYPDELTKLAPDYLNPVPMDPFTGKPLAYRKVGKGFILYSLGPDQKDDNGKPEKCYLDNRPSYDIGWKVE